MSDKVNLKAVAQKRSLEVLRETLVSQGGMAVWSIAGDWGRLEMWQVGESQRLIHGLPGNNGVLVYRPIQANTFDELVEQLKNREEY